MARVLDTTADLSLSSSILFWLWLVFGLLAIPGMILSLMARTKMPGKGGGKKGHSDSVPGSSRGKKLAKKATGHGSKGKEKVVEVDTSLGKRKREEAGAETISGLISQRKASIRQRDVTCERQLLAFGLRNNPAYDVFVRKSLHIYMGQVMEYDLDVVREFYAEMVINTGNSSVKSTIGGITFCLTPDIIAMHIGYTRPPPGRVLFSRRPLRHHYSRAELAAELCSAETAWVGGPLSMGQMKPHYRLLAKILQYNVYPRGNFKRVALREAELLVACFSSEDLVDYAEWIWQEIADFGTIPNPKMRLPYPALITRMAQEAGVPVETLTRGKPGPISIQTVTKAKAQTSVRHGVDDDYEPEASLSMISRIEHWCRAHFQRQTELIREVRDLRHRVDFVLEVAEEQSRRTFVPPPEPSRAPPQPRAQDPPSSPEVELQDEPEDSVGEEDESEASEEEERDPEGSDDSEGSDSDSDEGDE